MLRSWPKRTDAWAELIESEICLKRLALTGGALLALIQFILAPNVQSAETDEFHPHTLGVFLGGTDESGGSTEFTYGLEYAFRFNDRVGVGLVRLEKIVRTCENLDDLTFGKMRP